MISLPKFIRSLLFYDFFFPINGMSSNAGKISCVAPILLYIKKPAETNVPPVPKK